MLDRKLKNVIAIDEGAKSWTESVLTGGCCLKIVTITGLLLLMTPLDSRADRPGFDFDLVTLSTDLIAAVVSIEDDIVISDLLQAPESLIEKNPDSIKSVIAETESVVETEISVEPATLETETTIVAAIEPTAIEPEATVVTAVEPIAIAPETTVVAKVEPITIEPETTVVTAVEPIAIEPETTVVTAVEPIAIEPEATVVTAVEPIAIEPEATVVTAVEPIAIEPETTVVTAVEPIAIEPESILVAAVEPMAIEPEVTKVTAIESIAIEPEATVVTAIEPITIEPEATVVTEIEPIAAESEATVVAAVEAIAIEPESTVVAAVEPIAIEPESTVAAVEFSQLESIVEESKPIDAESVITAMVIPVDDQSSEPTGQIEPFKSQIQLEATTSVDPSNVDIAAPDSIIQEPDLAAVEESEPEIDLSSEVDSSVDEAIKASGVVGAALGSMATAAGEALVVDEVLSQSEMLAQSETVSINVPTELVPEPVHSNGNNDIEIASVDPETMQPELSIPTTGVEPIPLDQVVTEEQEQRINEDQIILDWAIAWSENDVEQYLSFYDESFTPADTSLDRDRWETLRRTRLKNKEIRIIVSNAEVFRANNEVTEIRFTQRYTSQAYRDRVIKSIEMIETPEGWRFISERTIEVLNFK